MNNWNMGVTKTPTFETLTIKLENPYLFIFCLSDFSPTCFRKQIKTFTKKYVCGKWEGKPTLSKKLVFRKSEQVRFSEIILTNCPYLSTIQLHRWLDQIVLFCPIYVSMFKRNTVNTVTFAKASMLLLTSDYKYVVGLDNHIQ